MKHIVFLDLSFNNTAICKYNIDKKTYEYFLLANHFSYSSSEKSNPLLSIKFDKIIKAKNLDVTLYKKKPQSRPKGDPTKYCRYMLTSCNEMSTFFTQIMHNKVLFNMRLEETIFGIEDYAIAIKSGNVTETAEVISSCKNALISLGAKIDNFHFFQPQGLKSVTGNGNANKQMMLDYFIKKNVKGSDVNEIIALNHKSFRKTNGKDVIKPIEDLVDSFIGVQAIRNKLNL